RFGVKKIAEYRAFDLPKHRRKARLGELQYQLLDTAAPSRCAVGGVPDHNRRHAEYAANLLDAILARLEKLRILRIDADCVWRKPRLQHRNSARVICASEGAKGLADLLSLLRLKNLIR